MPRDRGPRGRKPPRKENGRPNAPERNRKSGTRCPSTTAILLTGIAILAVVRASAAGGDVAANIVAALAALAALVALSAMSDGGGQNSSAQSQSEKLAQELAQERAYAELLDRENRGVVKRFSQRNGWGLISCEETTVAAPDSRTPGEPRRDVRFYRKDAEALSLNIGDMVRFRAVPDDDAVGWLRAVSIERDSSTETGLGDCTTTPKTPSVDESSLQDTEEKLQLDTKDDSLLENASRDESAPSVAPTSTRKQDHSEREIDRGRPETTPVVARRLVHSHLEVPLNAEHRAQEREFWSGSESPPKTRAETSQRKEEAPAIAPAPVKPLRRQPLATLRAATAPDGLPLLAVAAATAAGQDFAVR